MVKVILPALALLVMGCSTLANTPAQDRTYAAYERCRAKYPAFYLRQVYADGRFSFSLPDGTTDAGPFVQCMTGKSTWYAK